MSTRPWLDHHPVQGDLHCPGLSLYHYLKQTADQYPQQVALIYSSEQVTYREMLSHIDRVAAAFTAMGLKKGDRIALLLTSSPAYVYSYYAAMRQGIIVVNFNPPVSAGALNFMIRDTKARLLIATDIFLQDLDQTLQEHNLAHLVVAPLLGQDLPPGAQLFGDLLKSDYPAPPDVKITPEKDLAVVQYTSGTTGFPKGAMLTHANLVSNAEMTKLMLQDWHNRRGGEETLCLSLVPFYLNSSLTIPAGQILVPLIDIELILDLIRKHRPALFPGVPDLYTALMHHPAVDQYNLDSVELCISGDSPMSAEAIENFEEKTGCSILEGYGLAEASPITHCNPFLGMRKPGSIGIPYPGTDCKIVDLESGERELPPGEKGELAVSGPQVMKGYWNLPNETVGALRNGWLYTGDIAYMDEDGYFYIVDRKSNMINFAGNKIFPSEIEKVIYEHSGVAEAVCIGVPEKYFGEVVKAFVVLREGAAATAEEIIEFCRSRLVKFKAPRRVELRSELPKSAAGKILRYQLIREEQRRRLLDR